MNPRRVVVIGGTGATGHHVIGHLLLQKDVERVTALGRRTAFDDALLASYSPSTEAQAKFVYKQVEMGNIKPEDVAGHDSAVCTLGTTRGDAGSAEAFRKVDYDYVAQFADVCKGNNIKHFSLMTSTGANKNSWFLYMRTKGEIEDYVSKLGFDSVSIFRPGLLDRGAGNRRFAEKLGRLFMRSIHVEEVGRGIVADLVRRARQGQANTGTQIFDNSDIRKFAAEIDAAASSKESE